MSAEMIRPVDLSRLQLAKSSHQASDLSDPYVAAFDDATCLLEAVAFVAGEPWSDHPDCVSAVLGAFGRRLNDLLPDIRRQELVPLIPRLVGTAGDGMDEIRSWMALDWLLRTYTPTWLRLVPELVSDADALAGMPEIVDIETATAAGDKVRAARAATRAAVGAAAAARDAATDAATSASTWAATAAACAAMCAAILLAAAPTPTVTMLQASAIDLFARMVDPT